MHNKYDIPEKLIIETLEGGNCSWQEFFLIGQGEFVSIFRFVSNSGLLELVIEDDNLANACKNWLKINGSDQFEPIDEVKERFNWDGEFRIPPNGKL